MRKSLFLLMIVILVPFINMAQSSKFNQSVHDPNSDRDILIGYCTRDSLQGSLFKDYFTPEYASYKPDKEVMNKIMEKPDNLRGVHAIIVMGTWCSDSQQQVPRFYKIMDNLQQFGNTTIICVDKQKLAGDVSLEGMNLLKVPTFIFQRKGTELGRIIESPKISIEQDLFDIISK